MLPNFKGKTALPTANIGRKNSKIEDYFDLPTNSEFVRKCFFKRVVSLWNQKPKTKNQIKNQKKMQICNSRERNEKFPL